LQCFSTFAKSGEHVEHAFLSLAR